MSEAELKELRKETKKFIDRADERVLRMVYAMLEADARLDTTDVYLSKEQETILNEQVALYEKGEMKFSSWDDAKQRIISKMKLNKRFTKMVNESVVTYTIDESIALAKKAHMAIIGH